MRMTEKEKMLKNYQKQHKELLLLQHHFGVIMVITLDQEKNFYSNHKLVILDCAKVIFGDKVVIGAGSVVVKDIPSNCVAVGNPCKVIRADKQRKGYAKEAAVAVRDWAFMNTPFNVIYSYMINTNEPSCKTAISYGCKQVDEFKDDVNEITKVFAISREEWSKR